MKLLFTPELVLGLFLIVWGISLLIKLIWGLEIPIFKPFLALFLIYLGITILLGHQKHVYRHDVYTFDTELTDKKTTKDRDEF